MHRRLGGGILCLASAGILACNSNNEVTAAGTSATRASMTQMSILSVNNVLCSTTSCAPSNSPVVTGVLDVTVDLSVGSSGLAKLNLVLNCSGGGAASDVVVASQSFTPAAVASGHTLRLTLSVNTASRNAQSGAPLFPNGPCVVKTLAISPDGTSVTSSGVSVVLSNS